jgi:hypothetical protein
MTTVHTHTCIHTCVNSYINTYICRCMHAYIHTYIHAAYETVAWEEEFRSIALLPKQGRVLRIFVCVCARSDPGFW